MKNFSYLLLFCAISIFVTPFTILKNEINLTAEATESIKTTRAEITESPETITVFRSGTSEIQEIDLFEYVCGSVAAEMPLSYHEEALKAQAVACYTNGLRLKNNGNSPYAISDDSAVHQGYLSKSQRQEKWGDDFNKYESKLKNIVSQVENEAIYYDDELCVAAFHAICSERTESAENTWGEKIPYLVSVKSDGDKLSPDYSSTVVFDKKAFSDAVEKSEIKNIKSLKNSIKITKKSKSGTVLKATVMGKEFTGDEVRKTFSLKSPVFAVKCTDNAVTFNVTGYGHGVGMSQYGADFMARQGSDYKDILKHYYSGVEIKSHK